LALSNGQPAYFGDAAQVADSVIAHVGPRLVVGLPPGLGKANRVINALFDRVAADQTLSLEIFTALSLEVPTGQSDIEKRFIAPLAERLFDGCERLSYVAALRAGSLPPNISVSEFYFVPGRWIGETVSQHHYTSANYADACRLISERGINVAAQIVARERDSERYSLSCNPDLLLDLLPYFRQRRAEGNSVALVAEINDNLPYMAGSAEVDAADFDYVLDMPDGGFRLFGAPKRPITLADHALGLQAASLVPDGGTLQIGIGAHADALVHGLQLRQRDPSTFCDILSDLGADPSKRETARFQNGLYGLTEMFVDGFLDLYRSGVLSRKVHADPEVMRGAEAGEPAALARLDAEGILLHGAFFLGPEAMYQTLREMPEAERALFRMEPISFTNRLLGGEEIKRLQRRDARFVNSAMIATLLGASASDALENGQVVSGVGGQQEFQLQARELARAKAILMLNAARQKRGRRHSNIVWTYGHTTIPRHLRDVFVTEYGVAETADLSDRDTIVAMLSIAESRFHDELLRAARRANKIEPGLRLPAAATNNEPARIEAALGPRRERSILPAFPFESGFTDEEETLAVALTGLTEMSPFRAFGGTLRTMLTASPPQSQETALLRRMDLESPVSLRDRFTRALILFALRS
jgi:acyl-CoA hydrolase